MDLYAILDYRLIDTASPVMADYNWVYLPFNAVEALIWFGCAGRVAWHHRQTAPRGAVAAQAAAFVLFGLSDVMELWATTPLLLLFKLAVLLALVAGHHRLKRSTPSPTASD